MSARSWALLGCALMLGACASPPPRTALEAKELESPAPAGGGEPNLAVTPDGRVLLSWIEKTDAGHALRLATRRAGEPWSTPATIAEGAGWFVNWADFPSVAALPDGTLYAHWLAKSGASTYAYDVRVARSTDGGRTWSPSVAPHRDGTQTEHGFASMTPWGAGMGIVWLDGRKTSGAHEGQAEMSLVHTTLDREGALGPETVLDGRVCDCCQTDAAVAGDVTVVVYRDRSPAEVRDMSVVRFADGRWSEPRPLAKDGWEINGCPVNGPAIAAAGRDVGVAWFTAAADKSLVKLAFSNDAGGTFAEPIVVDDQRPLGRVDILMRDDASVLVSWLQQVGNGARVRVRRIARDGRMDEPITVGESTGARSSGFPRMARLGDEVVVAWRDANDPPRVRTAILGPSR